MKIIRIEHKDGRGCFNSNIGPKLENFLPDLYDRHFDFAAWKDNVPHVKAPWAEDDYLDLHKDNKEWFCAFKSLQQFQILFKSEEVVKLIDVGYNVFLLEVYEFQLSPTQVLFTKESIKKKTNINELFSS